MSLEYAERRIKEALKLAGGNAIKARQQVIAWTYEDTKLLHALAKPHLSGIVAYNIERVASGRADAARHPQAVPVPKETPKPANKQEQFGLEILKVVASSGAQIFGLEDQGLPHKRNTVSKSHIEAIEAMTKKAKSPKKPPPKK